MFFGKNELSINTRCILSASVCSNNKRNREPEIDLPLKEGLLTEKTGEMLPRYKMKKYGPLSPAEPYKAVRNG